MGEEKEKKKKKKKKEEKKEEAPVVEEVVVVKKLRKKKSTKKRASTPNYSGALSIFTEKQLLEFKQGFNYMDQDKDGIITKADLFRTFDTIGTSTNDNELGALLGEAPNPMTFTQMLTLFAERMQGKVDDDDLIIDSFKAYDEGNGTIDPEAFETIMMSKGEALNRKEVDEIFPELPRMADQPDKISMAGVIGMLVAPKQDGEATASEAEPEPVAVEA